MCHLTSTETKCNINLVTFRNELFSCIYLCVHIISINVWRHTYFLYLNNMLLFLGFLFPARLLVAIFTVIYDFAYWWICLR